MKCGSNNNPKNCMMYDNGRCVLTEVYPQGNCPWKVYETNADKIRAMSDEELSVFLREVMCKGAALEACDAFWEDTSFELDWLKQEVSE